MTASFLKDLAWLESLYYESPMRSKKPWQVSLMVISPERPGLKHQRQYQFSSEHSEKDARSKAIEEAEKSGLRVVEVVWIKQKYEYT